jgi:hypothetical protein
MQMLMSQDGIDAGVQEMVGEWKGINQTVLHAKGLGVTG